MCRPAREACRPSNLWKPGGGAKDAEPRVWGAAITRLGFRPRKIAKLRSPPGGGRDPNNMKVARQSRQNLMSGLPGTLPEVWDERQHANLRQVWTFNHGCWA